MAMKFPQYVSTDERTIRVVGLIDYKPLVEDLNGAIDGIIDDESTTEEEKEKLEKTKEDLERRKVTYQDGKGYVDEDEHIWIFCSAGKPKNHNAYPYFWLDENGDKVFSDPPELIRKAYCVDRMVDLSLIKILEETVPGEQLYDEEELNDINASSGFFIPTFKENDDFLKKVVKTTILQKGININRLKSKTEEKYQLPNMKSALQHNTKMSVIYFCSWMELLGCDFEITVIDNGRDGTDPLKYPLVFQSYTDRVSEVVNGEVKPIPPSKFLQSKEEDD